MQFENNIGSSFIDKLEKTKFLFDPLQFFFNNTQSRYLYSKSVPNFMDSSDFYSIIAISQNYIFRLKKTSEKRKKKADLSISQVFFCSDSFSYFKLLNMTLLYQQLDRVKLVKADFLNIYLTQNI